MNILASWYDYPQYYDLAFRSETPLEADFIEAACRKYCPSPARNLLEPACGSGRLVVELAARGYGVSGFDHNGPALAYLRRRLTRRRLEAEVFCADMAAFRSARPIDAAYNTFDSFRHLLTEDAARRHLECVADCLRPAASTSSASTCCRPTRPRSASSGGPSATAARRSRSRSGSSRPIAVAGWNRSASTCWCGAGRKTLRLRDEFSLRMYTAAQFRRLLAAVPALRLRDVYDFWYEIDHPLKLDDKISDTVFILQKT